LLETILNVKNWNIFASPTRGDRHTNIIFKKNTLYSKTNTAVYSSLRPEFKMRKIFNLFTTRKIWKICDILCMFKDNNKSFTGTVQIDKMNFAKDLLWKSIWKCIYPILHGVSSLHFQILSRSRGLTLVYYVETWDTTILNTIYTNEM